MLEDRHVVGILGNGPLGSRELHLQHHYWRGERVCPV